MEKRTLFRTILKSFFRAILKSIPFIGSGLDQAVFGTIEAIQKVEINENQAQFQNKVLASITMAEQVSFDMQYTWRDLDSPPVHYNVPYSYHVRHFKPLAIKTPILTYRAIADLKRP